MAPGGRLIVGSYNVHGCIGQGGRRDVARIARVIESLQADIIALQEVSWPESGGGSPPLDILHHLTGLEAIGGPTMQRGDGHYGNAVLTRLPVRAVRRLDLTFPGREPRGALDVDLDAAGMKVRVVATHLGLSPRERRYQVQCILQSVAFDDEGLTLLLGDINEWLISGRPLRWLHARFGPCAARATYPARFPVFALDRIWAHPSTAVVRFEARSTPDSRVASDHLPVCAEISLARTAGTGPAPAAPSRDRAERAGTA